MLLRVIISSAVCLILGACATLPSLEEGGGGLQAAGPVASAPEALSIGETFTIDSVIMGESRRVNVFIPTMYGKPIDAPMPVLYMPDGGLDEDFLHVAGLMQVLMCNGGMRPFVLVGIPNTQRRRDLTGPTENPEDRKIAPVVGQSAMFRRFMREELMPIIRERYRTTDERAIVGESLAGLFVIETLFTEVDLFETYIAIDPSVWWNHQELVHAAESRLRMGAFQGKSVYIASSSEPDLAKLSAELNRAFQAAKAVGMTFQYDPMPTETHATIYHPAALKAFRSVLAPKASPAK